MKYAVLLISCMTLLSGCGGTADCNDSSVKDTVTKIIEAEVNKVPEGKKAIEEGIVDGFEINDIKVTNRDEQLDTYSCEATVNFEYNGQHQAEKIQYDLSYLKDKGDTEIEVYNTKDIAWRFVMLKTKQNMGIK